MNAIHTGILEAPFDLLNLKQYDRDFLYGNVGIQDELHLSWSYELNNQNYF